MTLMAYRLSCCCVRSPCSAVCRMACVLVSTLATTGGSASRGRRRTTWFTLACTSWNATSMRFSRPKVITTCEFPGDEVDWMCSMPGTLFTAVSIRLVIDASMMSGFAPRYAVLIEMIGNSM
jgi:hypothetical protein